MIEGLPLVEFSGPAALCLIALLVITEKLVWHKRLDVLQKQIDAKDALIASLTEQNTMLLNSAIPTVNAVLGALHDATGDGGGGRR